MKAFTVVRPIVSIFETNAGDILLRADGGTILYGGGIDTVASECEYVATHPDGDALNWSEDLQFPWTENEPGTPIAVWIDGTVIVNPEASPGNAGRKYLGLTPD